MRTASVPTALFAVATIRAVMRRSWVGRPGIRAQVQLPGLRVEREGGDVVGQLRGDGRGDSDSRDHSRPIARTTEPWVFVCDLGRPRLRYPGFVAFVWGGPAMLMPLRARPLGDRAGPGGVLWSWAMAGLVGAVAGWAYVP